MCRNGQQWQVSLVNILRSKQKKKAILIFEESSVDIAAMLNTKRVTDYAEFNVKCVQKWSKSQRILLHKPWLALLGRWEGIETVQYVYTISSVILWDISNNKSSTQQQPLVCLY